MMQHHGVLDARGGGSEHVGEQLLEPSSGAALQHEMDDSHRRLSSSP
jgi:hypothetical protein